MKKREQLLVMVNTTAVVWHESGENPAIFCYLISWDAITKLRSHMIDLIPDTTRPDSACWNRSFTSSVLSTLPTDSKN